MDPTKWRFRTNFFGHLVLQRNVLWMDDGRECSEWRDATVADLTQYLTDIRA